ncbi:hypothetical protein GCM10023146_16620 [Nocardioides caricicola]
MRSFQASVEPVGTVLFAMADMAGGLLRHDGGQSGAVYSTLENVNVFDKRVLFVNLTERSRHAPRVAGWLA